MKDCGLCVTMSMPRWRMVPPSAQTGADSPARARSRRDFHGAHVPAGNVGEQGIGERRFATRLSTPRQIVSKWRQRCRGSEF
jgi:hypothetical protein